MPGRVGLPAGKTELFFRVNSVFRGKTLALSAGDRVILTKKRSVMLPGEMERLKADLSGLAGGGELVLKVI